MFNVSVASFLRTLTSFTCVLLSSAVNWALVSERRAVVARSSAVSVARFPIAAMVSSSNTGCNGRAFAVPY